MATENQFQFSQTNNILSLAGRNDITNVTVQYKDGSLQEFPSIDSVASASSNHTTSDPYRSRSSSFQGGRYRANTCSSTSSARENFQGLDIGGAPNERAHGRSPSINTRTAPTPSTLREENDSLDFVGVGEEWESTATLRPDLESNWADINVEHDHHSNCQEHLVRGVQGGPDLRQNFDNMGELMDDTFNTIMAAGDSVDAFTGPSSAPPAPSWMQRQHRSDSMSVVPSTVNALDDQAFDITSITASKRPRKPGRIPGTKLPEEKRKKVAKMRVVGSCSYCRDGRRGCEVYTPCRACILHFGPELLDEPYHCRRDIVVWFRDQILAENCKWHPYPRVLTDFVGRDYWYPGWQLDIPIQFRFGPCMQRNVQVFQTSNHSHLKHHHVNYPSTYQASVPYPTHDLVLPVTFTDDSDLHIAIDQHLALLVDEHFSHFNYYFDSPFKILHNIHKLYIHYTHANQDYAHLLHQALKLLVLIHSSEITVPTDDPAVSQILTHFFPDYSPSQKVVPCILRAELGKVVPQLARILLEDVLKGLFRICLNRRCDQHPIVIATFSVLMMTIESIMYHSARIGFHAHTAITGPAAQTGNNRRRNHSANDPFYSMVHPIESASALQETEKATTSLQMLYQNCFENCHSLMLRAMERRHFTALQKSFGEVPTRFIAALNQAIRDAGSYLDRRAKDKLEEMEDISCLFDRLIARLYLLQMDPD